MATDLAVVRDMARGHDVVMIADPGHRLRLRTAADRVMLADDVVVTDLQEASLAREGFVQWVGAQAGSSGDGVPRAQRGPALDVNIGLEPRRFADGDILLD